MKLRTKKEKEEERLANTPVDWLRHRAYINKVDKIEERMDSLEKQFGLFQKLYAIADENNRPIEEIIKSVEKEVTEKEPYRDVVNEILNDKFKIEFESKGENFLFTLIVPEENSNLSPSDYRAMRGDRRSAVLSKTMGENEVRDFCEKIKKNLKLD